MLHASVLETGKDDEIILGKWVGDTGIIFQPTEGSHDLFEDSIQL